MADVATGATTAAAGRLSLLRDPLSRLNVATFFLSLTIYSPILVLFYTGRGLSLFQVLALEAFNSAVMLLFEVPTGVIGDRLGLKRAVFLGHALQGAWILILIAAQDYWLFLLGYFMLGLAITFRSGSTEAWVYELLKRRGEERRMSRAQGTLWAAQLVGRVASALLAVLVVRAAGERYFVLALALSAAAFFLSALLVLTVEGVPVAAQARERSGLALARDGARLLRHHPGLRRIALAGMVTEPLPYALLFLYQPYFQASGTPLAFYGLAAAAGAAVGALSARLAHRLEASLGRRGAFVAAVALPSLLYLVMAGVFQAYLAALLYVLTFGLMQTRYPLLAAMRNLHIASYNRATALSLISMLEGGWVLLGKLVVGRVADVSLSYAFVLLGVVPLVGLAAFWLREEDLQPTVAVAD